MKATAIKYGFVINKNPRGKEQVLRLQAKVPRPREYVYLGHVGPCLPRCQMAQPPAPLPRLPPGLPFLTSASLPSRPSPQLPYPIPPSAPLVFSLSPASASSTRSEQSPSTKSRATLAAEIRCRRQALSSPAADGSLSATSSVERASRCVLAM